MESSRFLSLPKLKFDQEFDHQLNDCVIVPRRVSQRYENRFGRGFEFQCVFEKCVYTQSENTFF